MTSAQRLTYRAALIIWADRGFVIAMLIHAQDLRFFCHAADLLGEEPTHTFPPGAAWRRALNPGPTRTLMRAKAVPEEDFMMLKTPQHIAPFFVELALLSRERQGKWINTDLQLKERRK